MSQNDQLRSRTRQKTSCCARFRWEQQLSIDRPRHLSQFASVNHCQSPLDETAVALARPGRA